MFGLFRNKSAYNAGFLDGYNDSPYALNHRIDRRSYCAGYRAGSQAANRESWLLQPVKFDLPIIKMAHVK